MQAGGAIPTPAVRQTGPPLTQGGRHEASAAPTGVRLWSLTHRVSESLWWCDAAWMPQVHSTDRFPPCSWFWDPVRIQWDAQMPGFLTILVLDMQRAALLGPGALPVETDIRETNHITSGQPTWVTLLPVTHSCLASVGQVSISIHRASTAEDSTACWRATTPATAGRTTSVAPYGNPRSRIPNSGGSGGCAGSK